MTTWAQGTTRGERKAKADTLEHDNYQCQLRLNGCTELAATTITTSNGELQSACPHCLDEQTDTQATKPKRQRKPRKQTR